MIFFKKDKKKLQKTSQDFIKELKAVQAKLEDVSRELEEFKSHAKKALTKVSVVRYNPFREIGGDQSFSIALLDENNNGVVMTSYYGREVNRMYAKPIQGGSSEYQLSKEEEEAIQQAVKSEIRNPKSETNSNGRNTKSKTT